MNTTDPGVCVTHQMLGVRSCMQRDRHYAACEGDCDGCVPRDAQHGFLCGSCWRRLQTAVREWETDFFPYFAGEVRAVQLDPANTHPSASIPLTPLQLAIDSVNRLLSTRPPTVAMWPETVDGAMRAVEFTREAERAIRDFPTREQQSKIPTTRCPECHMRTLVYNPTPFLGGEPTVVCLNHGCGNVMDHSSFEVIALIEAQCCRRCRTHEACANTACTCHLFAPVPEWERTTVGVFEAYNPTNPDHAALAG